MAMDLLALLFLRLMCDIVDCRSSLEKGERKGPAAAARGEHGPRVAVGAKAKIFEISALA